MNKNFHPNYRQQQYTFELCSINLILIREYLKLEIIVSDFKS